MERTLLTPEKEFKELISLIDSLTSHFMLRGRTPTEGDWYNLCIAEGMLAYLRQCMAIE